ncbi:MAG: hypothetical protein ACJA1A_003127 [Saprospiraceae bacterium]|jgi:hypothetical protein
MIGDFSTSVEIAGLSAFYSSTSLGMTMLLDFARNDNAENAIWFTHNGTKFKKALRSNDQRAFARILCGMIYYLNSPMLASGS